MSSRPLIVSGAARAALAAFALSSLVSLMVSFMGGDRGRSDVAMLEAVQWWGIAFSVAVALCSFYYLAKGRGAGETLRAIWQHVPGWLVFSVLLLNSLTLIGELSYLLLTSVDLPATDWRNHAALACLMCSSLAFSILFAADRARAGKQPYGKARW